MAETFGLFDRRSVLAHCIDLTEAARHVLETQAPTAVARNIDLGLEETGPVPVIGDGTMLREMIVNLVDNALRYSSTGGSVTVRLAAVDGEAVLTVADDGPGIPVDERDHVFERFYRIAGSTEEGSGLGLAIVREVVENAGGRVTLRDGAGDDVGDRGCRWRAVSYTSTLTASRAKAGDAILRGDSRPWSSDIRHRAPPP